MDYCVSLKDAFRESKKEAGTKAYNLSLLMSFGFPVPRGFVIKSGCFLEFLEKTGIKEKIEKILSETSADDATRLVGASHEIKKAILSADMPPEMKESLSKSYAALGEREDIRELNDAAKSIMNSGRSETNVAVRGSVPNDEFRNSFAGCVRASLNVRGKIGFLDAVKSAWASFYSEHAIFYREKTGNQNIGLALVIQNMVRPEKSGTIFTANPVTGSTGEKIIEASYGTGESISLGAAVPDRYTINKESQIISDFSVGRKEWMYSENEFEGGTRKESVSLQKRESQVLSLSEIKLINELAGKIEERAKVPQDIEWAVSRGRTYILQARPVIFGPEHAENASHSAGEVLCSGTPASRGISEGAPKSFYEPMGNCAVAAGDVLVSKEASPAILPASKKACGAVCEEGGILSCAAILLREFHIPLIVGAKGVVDLAGGRETIRLDAAKGNVYGVAGAAAEPVYDEAPESIGAKGALLATKIRLCSQTLGEIESAPASDGHLVLGNSFYSPGSSDPAGELAEAAERAHPAKLWIRMPKAGEDTSGAASCINGAVSRGYRNIGIMIPSAYSRTHVEEARQALSTGGADLNSLELGILVDSPAGAVMACEFAQAGITVACIDADTLVKNMFGLDASAPAANLETHPAFLHILERCVRSCKKQKMHTAFFGSASADARMIDKLVEFGIDSICVPREKENMARYMAARAERKMLIELLKNRERFLRKGAE